MYRGVFFLIMISFTSESECTVLFFFLCSFSYCTALFLFLLYCLFLHCGGFYSPLFFFLALIRAYVSRSRVRHRQFHCEFGARYDTYTLFPTVFFIFTCVSPSLTSPPVQNHRTTEPPVSSAMGTDGIIHPFLFTVDVQNLMAFTGLALPFSHGYWSHTRGKMHTNPLIFTETGAQQEHGRPRTISSPPPLYT